MADLKHIDGGLVVLFEGIDGVGKTTQLERAAKTLSGLGWAVETTRNLGGTPIGEALRQVVLANIDRPAVTDFYLSVAIQAALAEKLTALRRQGRLVLIDRGPLSLAAYHLFGNRVSARLGWRYVDAGMKAFRPELSILYTADVQTAHRRIRQPSAGADYYESKPVGYFERVARGYEAAAERYRAERVDANQSIGAVAAQTFDLIQAALAAKTAGA